MIDLPHFWIIEPRDPLIARDGRPFGPNPGARATTLPFPLPSSVIGTLRRHDGCDAQGLFDTGAITRVLETEMRGPLLVMLNDDTDDTIADWLFPAPADAQLFSDERASTAGVRESASEESQRVVRRCLAPYESIQAIATASNQPEGLRFVGTAHPETTKPISREKAPNFWRRTAFEKWLEHPVDDEPLLHALGIPGLELNIRMHVSVIPETQTALEGALFQISGLEFTWRDREAAQGQRFVASRLALAAWTSGSFAHFADGLAPMGGERRLMRWRRPTVSATQGISAAVQQQIIAQIAASRRCRVILLTPAIFSDGYRPPSQWVRGGITAELTAAAVPRMQTVSGWDFAHRNKNGNDERPTPSRRLAPAGSVYFVEFPGNGDIRPWLDATWMRNVSDDVQDSRDGFGLAVLGVWPDIVQEEQQ
jgi:CRISPR-associated protein Cmr3